MLRKIMAGVLMIALLMGVIAISPIETKVEAFDNFCVEVTKDRAPIREGYYEEEKVIKRVDKGTILTIVGKKRNLKFNIWYKVQGGGYIYSGNVKKTHDHKVVFDKYGDQHPHYAEYKCKHCYNGAYCGNETTKISGCSQCYPPSTNASSQKQNTNKVPNSNVTTKADVLVPSRDSLQEEAEKNFGTPKHEHNYKFSNYASQHPHCAIYKCSCGSSYQDNGKTQKVTGCNTCYPPHTHSYTFIGYENVHPHVAAYECSCGSGYCDSSKTTTIRNCEDCYPYGYGNDHFCEFVYSGRNLNEHPHYAINICRICYEEEIDYDRTDDSSRCNICNNPFRDKAENIPDFYGRVYDLSTGEIIYTPKKVTTDELFDFAESLHLSLDTLGLIPAFGEVFDGINALYYIVEGDYVNAALSGMAVVPFVGTVSTTGKITAKAGKAFVTNAAQEAAGKIAFKEGAEEAFQNVTEKFAIKVSSKNVKRLSEKACRIINNYGDYPESVLRTIKNISDNNPIDLSKAFYNGDLLVGKKYTEVVTSSYTGLKYGYDSNLKKHRFYHILDKHSLSQLGKHGDKVTYFNRNGEDVIELIEDLYTNGYVISALDNNYVTSKTSYLIKSSEPIGFTNDGKTKLYNMVLVLDDDMVITAYPTLEETLQ